MLNVAILRVSSRKTLRREEAKEVERYNAEVVRQIVDATGQIRNTTQLFTREFIVSDITPNTGPRTFYSKFGDIFSYLCLLLTPTIAFLAYRS